MNFDARFRGVETRKDRMRLVEFAAKKPLDYPGYFNWLGKVDSQLERGEKSAIYAAYNGLVVGDVIWQRYGLNHLGREIKQLRVEDSVGGWFFAQFLLRQAERGLGEDFDFLTVDARAGTPMVSFLTSPQNRYIPIKQVNLYDDKPDVVLVKFPKGKIPFLTSEAA